MPFIILETPPFKTDARKNNTTKIFNKSLLTLQENHPNIKICTFREELKDLTADECMHDEIHIRRERPATIIVKKLEETIMHLNIPVARNTNTKTTKEYTIPDGKVGLIIGHKGTNLRKWTSENSVIIEVTKDEQPLARVTGDEPQVSTTINAMKDLVDRAVRRERDAPSTNWRHRPTTQETQRHRYSSRSPAPQHRNDWNEEEWRKPRAEKPLSRRTWQDRE